MVFFLFIGSGKGAKHRFRTVPKRFFSAAIDSSARPLLEFTNGRTKLRRCSHRMPEVALATGWQAMSQPFRLIAAKGMQNGIFRLWYGEAENDRSAFVLTLTPQYVAHALCKALPLTLEEVEEYAQQNQDRLRAIAHDARACGQNAKVLDKA